MYFLSFNDTTGDIYMPNSTHNGGGNALVRNALAREQSPGYDYFIFLDDDVHLELVRDPVFFWKSNMEDHPWRRFEDFLDKYKPSIGYPQYSWPQVSPYRGPYSL